MNGQSHDFSQSIIIKKSSLVPWDIADNSQNTYGVLPNNIFISGFNLGDYYHWWGTSFAYKYNGVNFRLCRKKESDKDEYYAYDLPIIQYGSYIFEEEINVSSGKAVKVTFATPFFRTPMVLVSSGNIQASATDTQVMCWAEDVSKTGFTLRAIRSTDHNYNEITWVAFSEGENYSHTYEKI